MATVLKPCPFCGGQAEVERIFANSTQVRYMVCCLNYNSDCLIQPETPWLESEEEAIEEWNRRAEDGS